MVTGTTISSTVFNALTADLATGLSTCVLKDGTQTTTAAVPFAAGITGTTAVLSGAATLNGGIVGAFTTQGTQAVVATVPVTLFTMVTRGTYIFQAMIRDISGADAKYGVSFHTGAGDTIATQAGGANVTFSLSGSSVQITNSATTSTYNWSYLFIPSGA